MSAEVESMMYVREKPWHGLGVMVEDAPNSKKALELAGLDWVVDKKPIYLQDGTEISGNYANVRDKDNRVLGIVGDRYKVVQNEDAFSFTDELIGGDVRYETAGSLKDGRTVWMLAKMPTSKVLGDEVEQYLCFTNSHDGTGSVKVCLTPVRVVCNNTLNFALNSAKRMWAVRHTGDVLGKVNEARKCLELAERYNIALNEYAYDMSTVRIDDKMLNAILSKCFPLKANATEMERKTVEANKEAYMVAYWMPDIAKFRGTAWGALNAMTDMVAHRTPIRCNDSYAENNWGRILNGHSLVDMMTAELNAIA